MKVSTQPYKGARDFYPEDKAVQKWLFGKWRTVVERYGYVEYDAPILEPTDLFLIKGSEEIIREQTYTFTDRGGRSVTIRTEMTPSVSRMVAGRRQELAYPARWYSIPNLWRYERMQRGRLREFWQLNVDMFGVASDAAELEMIQIIDDLFQAFNAKRETYVIKLNSRSLVNAVLKNSGIVEQKAIEVIRLIDRKNKMGAEEFSNALGELVANEESAQQIMEFLNTSNIAELSNDVLELQSVVSLRKILAYCGEQGLTNVEFDSSLMRGFDYYTDIVFEAFDTDPQNNRSILGGGRYDGLVGQMGVEPVPTIGFAVGDVVFKDFLVTHGLVPKLGLTNELTVLVKEEAAIEIARNTAGQLRNMGMNVAVDFSGRKLDKQLKSASKSGVTNVLFVDENSPEDGKYVLKNLSTGDEESVSIEEVVQRINTSKE